MQVLPTNHHWRRLKKLSQETNKRLLKHSIIAERLREEDKAADKMNGSVEVVDKQEILKGAIPILLRGECKTMEQSMLLIDETFKLVNETPMTRGENKQFTADLHPKSANSVSLPNGIASESHPDLPSAFTLRSRRSQWRPPDCSDTDKFQLFNNVDMIDCDAVDKPDSPTRISEQPMNSDSKTLPWCHTESPTMMALDSEGENKPIRSNRQPHKAYLFASRTMPIVVASAAFKTIVAEKKLDLVEQQDKPEAQEAMVTKLNLDEIDLKDSLELDQLCPQKSETHTAKCVSSEAVTQTTNQEAMFTNYVRITSPLRHGLDGLNHVANSPCRIEASPRCDQPDTNRFNNPSCSEYSPGRHDSTALRSILKGPTIPLRNSLENPIPEPVKCSPVNGVDRTNLATVDSSIHHHIEVRPPSSARSSQDSGRSSSPKKSVRFADQDDVNQESIQADSGNKFVSQPVNANGPVISVIYSKPDDIPKSSDTPMSNCVQRSNRLPSLSAPPYRSFNPQVQTSDTRSTQTVNSNRILRSRQPTATPRTKSAPLQNGNTATGYAELRVGRPRVQNESDQFVFANNHTTWAPSIYKHFLPRPTSRRAVSPSPPPTSGRPASPRQLRSSPAQQYANVRVNSVPRSTRPTSQVMTSSKLDAIARSLTAARTANSPHTNNTSTPKCDVENLANLTRLTELNYETSLAPPADTVHLIVPDDLEANLPDYEGVDRELAEKLRARNLKLQTVTHAIYLKGTNECSGNINSGIPERGATPCGGSNFERNATNRSVKLSNGTHSGATSIRNLTPLPQIITSKAYPRLLDRRPRMEQGYPAESSQSDDYECQTDCESNNPTQLHKSTHLQPLWTRTLTPTLPSYHTQSLRYSARGIRPLGDTQRPPYEVRRAPIARRTLPVVSSEPMRRKQYTRNNVVGDGDDGALSDSLTDFVETERACEQPRGGGILPMGKPPPAIKCHPPVPKPRRKRHNQVSSLSIEEARLIQSLDRLNGRLYDILSDRR